MPAIEINDEQILRCLDQLSPEGINGAATASDGAGAS